ncbi:malate dehydrogenase [Campylobacter sp. faydin G-140]|uniref:lactate/malate family dehydrogenase n=1 Tax=Campylobacter anatolicus TaxID=2829105 RepID=UPI001B957313|nr:malate dehydrogenase [Campylobacter anatolicus]MBR8465912.1 malate dehydrogenase [Campylobacter anatolicus]
MKISIIGAGNVGASIAYALAMRNVCDNIALVDIFGDVARAKAIDISQSSCVFDGAISVVGGEDAILLRDSDIVIITAGSPRKDGQSRDDLLVKNAEVVKIATQNIAKYAPNSLIIVVTNPLDVMVWVAYKFSGFKRERVMGMAGELDSARCRYELSKFKNVSTSSVSAKTIGAHNDKMIVSNANLSENLNTDELKVVAYETKTGGAKIVKLLGTSAYYAPAAAVVKMCEAIKFNKGESISACVILGDELSCGRVIKLGKDGVNQIFAPNGLSADELNELALSEEEISKNIKFLRQNL